MDQLGDVKLPIFPGQLDRIARDQCVEARRNLVTAGCACSMDEHRDDPNLSVQRGLHLRAERSRCRHRVAGPRRSLGVNPVPSDDGEKNIAFADPIANDSAKSAPMSMLSTSMKTFGRPKCSRKAWVSRSVASGTSSRHTREHSKRARGAARMRLNPRCPTCHGYRTSATPFPEIVHLPAAPGGPADRVTRSGHDRLL